MDKQPNEKFFWLYKPPQDMSPEEWESLCDGCGKCCVYQVEDEDNRGQYYLTNVACKLLDSDLCHCTAYSNRQHRVADCMTITPENISELDWLPASCAYRRVYFSQDLPEWHHLKSGDPLAVHKVGASISGRCISDDDISHIEDHIVIWNDF